MITQHAWMFLSSFEKLREKLQTTDTVNMAHLGPRAFEEIGGEVVQTTSFVIQKSHIKDHKGTYCRLIEPTTQRGKEEMFLSGENRYTAQQDNFSPIPGSPVAYWVSESILKNFSQIAKYFLYYAPNIDSAQSPGAIEGVAAQTVFARMIDRAGLCKKYKIVKRLKPQVWKDYQLDDDELDFEFSRFTCDQYSNESELHAVLRHLRNALAHGYVYVWKKKRGNYIFLTDYDKTKRKVTSKIMLSMTILEEWRAILEEQIATGE